MATVTQGPPEISARPDMVIPLGLVGPEGLEAAMTLIGDRSRPRLFYERGELTLMTPSALHEDCAERIADVVKAICFGLQIVYRPTGSTFFRRADLKHGIMADKSYYLENELSVRGLRDEIDLDCFPPPDLVVEVVVSHPAQRSLEICRVLGVPEVWVHEARRGTIDFLHLDAEGEYRFEKSSRAFPFLSGADLLPWLEASSSESYNEWESRLRDWVRDVLGPRRLGGT